MKHYYRSMEPSDDGDRRKMRKILKDAAIREDGSACFGYLPLDDEGHRVPLGEDVYTPYGWNMLGPTAGAFGEGKEIFFEIFGESN